MCFDWLLTLLGFKKRKKSRELLEKLKELEREEKPRKPKKAREKKVEGKESNRDRILKFLLKRRKPVTAVEIAEKLGLSPETVRRHLRKLLKEGIVEKTPKGWKKVR